jgi:hypothetical protein
VTRPCYFMGRPRDPDFRGALRADPPDRHTQAGTYKPAHARGLQSGPGFQTRALESDDGTSRMDARMIWGREEEPR